MARRDSGAPHRRGMLSAGQPTDQEQSRNQMATQNGELKDSLVLAQNSQGIEIHASLLRLTRYLAVFEIYNPNMVLHLSEVFEQFKIVIRDRTIYSGRAVLSSLVNTGAVIVCEVSLDEASFTITSFSPSETGVRLHDGFDEFLIDWQRNYKVLPEFKVVIADMQTFLSDLRLWLEQVELQIRSAPTGDRAGMERQTVQEIGQAMVPAFDALHERLEDLSARIEPELRPVHQNFSKRQLHPLMMCSPFAYRTYHKPLGYAGDYEMVNMILRSPFEGGSLFAKVVNLWFLSQWPAKAHRHRIQHLKNRLLEESERGRLRGKPIRVLNLGCGPALEVQEFLQDDRRCDFADLTLLDFSDEAIQHTRGVLDEVKRRLSRRTPIQLQRKSVHQLLKEGSKSAVRSGESGYDYIYCAGLFDYLSDRTCRQLLQIFHQWLEPGGAILVTNVNDTKPFRHMLEFVLDWHLVYRDERRCAALLPDHIPPAACRVATDPTGVNVFVELRKPDHA
jgi:extracellular factor (EF) 3-hydroxypalmitic acid methyl ester biosynthesis protein